MVIYSPDQPISFKDFGILIPISNSKADRTLQVLLEDPELYRHRDKWYQERENKILSSQHLLRVHSKEYIERLFGNGVEGEIIQTFGLIDEEGKYHRYNPSKAVRPLSEVRDWVLKDAAGTLQCCRSALGTGFCFNLGGGMHHAQRDRGNGFCLVHDILISIRTLQAEGQIQRAWVIDVDAHKGDGTAALTVDDPSVITLSIHMAKGWPLDGDLEVELQNRDPSYIPSDIDIPVGAEEARMYNTRLSRGLEELDSFLRPDLVLVVDGVDPYEKDELASADLLNLSLEELIERDQLVYRFLEERKLPVAYVTAGGYGAFSWEVYSSFLLWVLKKRLGLIPLLKRED